MNPNDRRARPPAAEPGAPPPLHRRRRGDRQPRRLADAHPRRRRRPRQRTAWCCVILRGGLDGLGAAPALGDPDFAAARGPLGAVRRAAVARSTRPSRCIRSLAELHAMYGRGELAIVHAVGLPYRERSHFDAQQVLESGGTRPYELSTGWLGRALAASGSKGLALNTTVPLVLRGPADVDTWAPSVLPDPSADLVARLERMYAGDPALATALERARQLPRRHAAAMQDAAPAAMAANGPRPGAFVALSRSAPPSSSPRRTARRRRCSRSAAGTRMPTRPTRTAPLANDLRQLDARPGGAARTASPAGGAWQRTVVVVVSEFGREVAVNGTLGTDHGTGGVAFVLGGAVQGGRVVADWPGLAKRPALRRPRPAHHHRPARGAQGRARRSPADRRAQPRRRGLPRQRQGQSRCSCCAAERSGAGQAAQDSPRPCARPRRDAPPRTPAPATLRRRRSSPCPSANARVTPSSMFATRIAAPAASASSAASAKLKVCGPITTGQPQAAASIRFWPPSGAKLPPSRATSASA